MRAKQPSHIASLNFLALTKNYIQETTSELAKLPQTISGKLFTKNLVEGLEQTSTLFYPKDWYSRFTSRTPIEKAFSVARYMGLATFAGLTAKNAVENGVTDTTTLTLGTAAAALFFLFSAQRISEFKEIKDSKGNVVKKLGDTMDRVNALDGVHATFAIASAATLGQAGYVAMGAAFAASALILPAIPDKEKFAKMRKAVADTCIALAVPVVAAVSLAQPELKDKIIQALPILPVVLGTYAGMQTKEKTKLGNALHFTANSSMAITGTLMGLFNVTVANGLGAANWATTIEKSDMPYADKKTARPMSFPKRVGAWLGVVKDHTKTTDYIYKSDLKPQ